jgi:starch-binding outer membrane protein SusE/F
MIRKYIALLGLSVLFLQSCEDEAFGPVLKRGAAPTITAPAANATFVLQENQAAQPFGTFTWTSADFGFEAGTRYTLEMDLAGNNFAAAIPLGAVNALQITNKTIGEINAVLINKNIAGGTPTDVQIRVVASVGDDVDPLISAPVTLRITPFESTVVYPQLQVPGSYQGWAPTDNNTVIFSAGFNKKYEGYVYFPNAGTEFKYTDGPAWDVNYGDDGANGTLEKNGANIVAADAGMYKLNVDLTALTHTYTRTSWGLIGYRRRLGFG